jgi:hypothetical protein
MAEIARLCSERYVDTYAAVPHNSNDTATTTS